MDARHAGAVQERMPVRSVKRRFVDAGFNLLLPAASTPKPSGRVQLPSPSPGVREQHLPLVFDVVLADPIGQRLGDVRRHRHVAQAGARLRTLQLAEPGIAVPNPYDAGSEIHRPQRQAGVSPQRSPQNAAA